MTSNLLNSLVNRDSFSAEAFLLDGDGVLYRGAQPLPGAQEFLTLLADSNTPYLLLTNNATRTPRNMAEKLTALGFAIAPEHIFTSAQATAQWLGDRYPAGSRILIVGMEGLAVALQDAGYEIVDDYRETDLVVASMDLAINYPKLAEAALAIRRGCPFIGTNPDRSYPEERGIVPGAGSIIALLETATDVSPVFIGKPQPEMFLQALERIGRHPGETVMVGDRYETDILGGHQAGLRTAAVLTGITTAEEFAAANPPPTHVFPGLPDLMVAWQNAG
ncbi:MAG: HAD-IIA family hydrolase [Chloroflexota bacterium]|nr:HAD-IIA family hydrolase [Chloroflexota bacterium]